MSDDIVVIVDSVDVISAVIEPEPDMSITVQEGWPGPMPELATVEEIIEGLIMDKAVSPFGLSQAMSYTHIQSFPSATWTIQHKLNRYPNVSVVDSAGSEVEGEVSYIDNNTIYVCFNGAFSGSAYLS